MSDESAADYIDYSFIKGGLLARILTAVGLSEPGLDGVRKRACAIVLITFVPTVLLAIWQGVAWGKAVNVPLLYDPAELCRFLLVGPLLIWSEAFVEPWIVQVVRHARDRLLSKEELQHHEKFIANAINVRDSYIVEVVLFASTFAFILIEQHVMPHTGVTTWRQVPSSTEPSYTYMYYAYFAKPLIRFLWLRWLWRYLIWSVWLVRLASMNIKVVPIHPDRRGGLGFISVGHTRFATLAATFGIQGSGVLGSQIIFEGKKLMSFEYLILGVVAMALFVFLAPLLAFTGKLMEAKRIALFEYGSFSDQYTTAFHQKWIHGLPNEELLGSSDIQSLADLSDSYDVVREMWPCLVGKDQILTVAFAVLVPFSPLVLSVYPFNELLNHLLKSVM
jgi:hypothetical protein